VRVANPIGPGWGNPQDGKFDDVRLLGTDGKRYGPLPREWAHYRGLYRNGHRAVISYSVGTTNLLEEPGVVEAPAGMLFTRTFNIGPRDRVLVAQVAHHADAAAQIRDAAHLSEPAADQSPAACVIVGPAKNQPSGSKLTVANRYLVAGIEPPMAGAKWLSDGHGNLRMRIPKGSAPLRFTLWTAEVDRPEQAAGVAAVKLAEPNRDLSMLTHGGPPQWAKKISTRPVIGKSPGPFAVDVLTLPADNPWQARVRFTGLDFLSGGHEAALCTWDGDVWIVGDLLDAAKGLTWQRIASGLFQPLGLKIVEGRIYVTCRDQIVLLRDLNGDRETDYYENFNNDHQVTDHFHEFAMGLQTDEKGNFYYAKAARHALPAVVPQHGTLLRVSPDGLKTEIVATGFRAANGVCLNSDGTFFLTDQEGFWTPKNRINWVQPGKFYGNMMGFHSIKDPSDAAMEQPVCWITNSFDRSPSEPLWVTGDGWKPLSGALLNLSYGYGRIHVILHEKVGDKMQGGMCALNLPDFPTGIIRGRFNPADGQLYTCGMYAWAGNATEPGGFYRVRYTGGPVNLPIGLSARREGMKISFTDPLEKQAACDAKNYAVKVWSLKRTAKYGSNHIDEHPLEVKAATLSDDGKTVTLAIPKIAPTWCMEIRYTLRAPGTDGKAINGVIHNTIHQLQD
ncbi:MAG: heme-binding protein, partial [Planctomycetia bacterium]|nr:heme-binding protein [Planctomycetia bacterium]